MLQTERTNTFSFLFKELYKIDSAVFFSFLNKGWAMIQGFVTIVLVTTYFTPEVQGFYYTFNNLLIFQALLDVGFGTVLVQFVTHEWASLELSEDGKKISGDELALLRLSALVRLSFKWYAWVSVSFLILVSIGGYFFMLEQKTENVDFLLPWILLCLSVSFGILFAPCRYLLVGIDKISKNQKILTISAVISSILSWIALMFGAELYVAFLSSFILNIVQVFLYYRIITPFLELRGNKGIDDKKIWREEFWTQQWKIAVSWLSGFFMFQSFIPITFYFLGSEASGKVGATLQIFTAVNLIGNIMVNVKTPLIGYLSAKKEFKEVHEIVKKTICKNLIITFVLGGGIVTILMILDFYEIKQLQRLTNIYTVLFFILSAISLQITHALTNAIRMQKKEPFLLNSITGAVLVCLSNVYFSVNKNILGMSISFFLILSFILIPWIYNSYKIEMKRNGVTQNLVCFLSPK